MGKDLATNNLSSNDVIDNSNLVLKWLVEEVPIIIERGSI